MKNFIVSGFKLSTYQDLKKSTELLYGEKLKCNLEVLNTSFWY